MLVSPAGGGEAFGSSGLALADSDGDGYQDLFVGADQAMSNVGIVYGFRGAATGIGSTVWTMLGGADGANAYFGAWIARIELPTLSGRHTFPG